MNHDNPANRWLVLGSALLIFIPIVCVLLFMPSSGAIPLLSQPLSWTSAIFAGCIAGYALACWLVLRRGQLLAAAITIMVCATLQAGFGDVAARQNKDATKYQLDFGKAGMHHGIDVYCNGTLLGRTPFLLTEAEFHQKVKPWNTPPEQPRVIYRTDGHAPGPGANSRWTLSASDVFEEIRDTGSSHFLHENLEFFQHIKHQKYWWRFECDGHMGLRQSTNNLSNGGGGTGQLMTYDVSLWSVQFPSLRPHFNRLLEAAKAVDYATDTPWLQHFFRHQNLLEPELYSHAEKHPAAEKLIQHIAAARYDVPEQFTETAARDLLDKILHEAEQREQFMTPSLAYTNAQRIAAEYPELIAAAYRNVIDSGQNLSSSSGMMGSNGVEVWYASGNRVRRRLLLMMIAETAPPAAFDHLVWDIATSSSGFHSDTELMTTLTSYQRPEAEQILKRWLYDTLGSPHDNHGGTFEFEKRRALDVMEKIEHPGLQDQIHQRVQAQFPMQHRRSHHELIQFFEYRLTHSQDLDRLARTIGQCYGLAPQDKAKLLWRIPTKNSGELLSGIRRELSTSDSRNFLSQLPHSSSRTFTPHPFAGKFLVDMIKTMDRDYPSYGIRYNRLLLHMKDDAAKQHLESAIADFDDRQWSDLTRQVQGTLPHLNWMVAPIAEFETSQRKQDSCQLLKAIGTPEAIQLLTLWSQSPRTSLSKSALQILKQSSQSPASPAPEKSIDQQLVKDANDLIAGLIQPDDLLPPATPATWTGDAYEIPGSDPAAAAKVTENEQPTPPVVAEEAVQDKPPAPERPTIQETIATLQEQGDTVAADYLSDRLPSADKFRQTKGWKYVFGRVIVEGPDSPRKCQSHVSIHSSGWFVGSVRDSKPEVGFHMFGYKPVIKQHDGPEATFVNVGDVVMKPYRFEQLGTVRAQLAFEGPVKPQDVSVRIKLASPKSRNSTGGTSGGTTWPEKEQATVSDDFRIQLTGLSPMPHLIYVKVDKHQPFSQEFEVAPGGTTDIGLLRIPVSPKFTLEYAASETLDFTDAARHNETLFTGDRFKTNPTNKHYVGCGPLSIKAYDGIFRMRCGYSGCVQVDLGEGTLDDFLKPAQPNVEKIRDHEADLTSGHVYLIHNSFKEWKHWTLIRVEMSSPYDTPARDAAAESPAE